MQKKKKSSPGQSVSGAGAAAKKSAKRATSQKPPTKTSIGPKTKSTPRKSPKLSEKPTREEIIKMIEAAAYYRSINESGTGDPQTDWLEAEKELLQQYPNVYEG